MNTLKITQLTADTFLGILPFEQKVKQTVMLDLEFELDIDQVVKTQTLEDTVDYSTVANALTQFIESHRFNLIEVMAAQISEFLKKEFKLKKFTLTIYKI